jgi:hypothetical protein
MHYLNKILVLYTLFLAVVGINQPSAIAAEKTTYTEQEFLSAFSGKSRKIVMDKLGAPAKKEQSVKPTNADQVLADKNIDASKPDNIEMWYYNKRVSYAPNKTFKFTELTFANDKCVNITLL